MEPPEGLAQASTSVPSYGSNGPAVSPSASHPLDRREQLSSLTSKKGRKPFVVSASVERGLLRLLNHTNVRFDRLANAVEQAKGPGKQWLRKRIAEITETSHFAELRLLNHPKCDEKRKKEQLAALELSFPTDTGPRFSALHVPVAATTKGTSAVVTSPSSGSLKATAPQMDSSTALGLEFSANDDTQIATAGNTASRVTGFAVGSRSESTTEISSEATGTSSCNTNVSLSKANQKQTGRSSDIDARGGTRSSSGRLQRDAPEPSETQPASSVDGQSLRSGPAKRTLTDDSNGTREEAKTEYAKRRRFAKILSMTSIVRHLENSGQEEPGYLKHIGKRCSATAETIASRISSRAQSRKPSKDTYGSSSTLTGVLMEQASSSENEHPPSSTESSEYVRFYDKPSFHNIYGPGATSETAATDPDEHPTTLRLKSGPVLSIVRARYQQTSDEEADLDSQNTMPEGDTSRRSYVNVPDERGVTALHLAVAYGYLRVCRSLLRYGADSDALTREGTSVSRFAKPAERLARDDLKLYNRIMHCREWVEYGKEPPLLKRAETFGQRRAKRQNSRRATREGSTDDERFHKTIPTQIQTGPNDASATGDVTYQSIASGSITNPTTRSTWSSGARMQDTDSLPSSSTRPISQGHSNVVDFAPLPAMSFGVAVSGGQAFTEAQQRNGSQYGSVSMAQAGASDSQRPGNEVLTRTPVVDTAARRSVVDPRLQPAVTIPEEQNDSQPFPESSWWLERENGGLQYGWGIGQFDTEPAHEEHEDERRNHPFLSQPQPQPRSQAEPEIGETAAVHASTGTMPTEERYLDPPNSTILSTIDANTPGLPAPIWYTCVHGHPYSDDRIYCPICSPAQHERAFWAV